MNVAASAPGDLLPGRWFDGRSSQAQPVLVGLQPTAQGPSLRLHPLSSPGAAPIVFACGDVGWPEAWSDQRPQMRVVVDLRHQGSLEIDAVSAWRAALAAAGERPGMAQRMQTRWSVLLGVTLAAIIGLGLFYRYGTPWAATQITRHVPLGWETSMADNVMRQLDEGMLKPSKLPADRQQALRARFDALVQQTSATPHRYPDYRPALALDFRAGMGANAFALPGGRIVMTDGMVKAAADQGLPDEALMGVLAHEIGHVMHRHGTRMVVEQGVLNVGLGLALGDVSSLVSTGASLLTGLAYSRNHEREADCYAIAAMRRAALPTVPMAQLLLAVARDTKEEAAAKSGKPSDANTGAAQQAPVAQTPRPDPSPVWSLLSSHPDTVQRAIELEQGHAPHCGKG
jgi:Zn-dependent protease with chaperone function